MTKTAVAVAPMKVAQVPAPGADFRIVERGIPDPVAVQGVGGPGHLGIQFAAARSSASC